MKPFVLSCLTIVLAASVAPAADPPRLELKDGDRVAFIGNTFVEREAVDCYIETMLISRYPDRNITFRNLGYSADTVTGEARGLCSGWSQFEAPDKAFERLRKLVAEYKPTVLLINYGMTESFFGPEKLAEFTANYNKMLDALSTAAGTSPRIILMSPNYHEDLGRPLPDPAEHNKNLKIYADVIHQIAAQRGGDYIDLFSITKHAETNQDNLTTNGIHFTPFGYLHISRMIESTLAGQARTWEVRLSAATANATVTKVANAEISDVKIVGGSVTLALQRDRLPEATLPAAAPNRGPHVKDALFVTDLPAGKYQLKVDNKILATETAEKWAAGVAITTGPDFDQAEVLRKVIVAKNFDYFNYQRPDNDSYILAFRKREQGRNAVEIPQFLPLVEEKEKQIAALRVPKPVTYTLEPVK